MLKLSQPRRPARMPTDPQARPRRPSGSLSRKRNGPTLTESLILALFVNLTIERSSSVSVTETRRFRGGAPVLPVRLPRTAAVMPHGPAGVD